MTRDEAIDILARHEVTQLGSEERASLLLDWWSIDADDPDYEKLPHSLRVQIARSDSPGDPQSPSYDPLLHLAVRRSYAGVVNSYLELRLVAAGRPGKVEGLVEELMECPCCGYRSLDERGGYEICRVCFWEDDGTTDPESMSSPNRMTLGEARRNFERLGAIDEFAVSHVLPDGRDRYASTRRELRIE